MDERAVYSHHSPQKKLRIVVPDTLQDILNTEKRRIGNMGPNYEVHARRLEELEKRLSEGRFHLAVLGQVKRGKSTLINALLGEEVLPSSVIPLTAIPTLIQYGEHRELRVRYQDDRPDMIFSTGPATISEDMNSFESGESSPQSRQLNRHLLDFVTESNNPRNEKGVLQVEVTHPAPVLNDVVIIDTPGIGSTYRHNTEVTMSFLSQSDAALFLVSVDPPITEAELTFLNEIKDRVSKLFFTLNKVDYLTKAELAEALTFYRKVLTEEAGIDSDTPIFTISARNALEAKISGNEQKWEESGLAGLSEYLMAFQAHEKSLVLKGAIGRKTLDVLNDIYLQTELEIHTLELPAAELESRLSVFEKKVTEAEQQRIHAQDVLNGDRKRVHELLEEHVEDLQPPLRKRLMEIAEKAMSGSPQDQEHAAQQAVADAIPELFEHEFATVSEVADREMVIRLKHQERLVDELVESIRKTASELFEIPYHAHIGEHVYATIRRPYFVEYDPESLLISISPDFIEHIMPAKMREKRAKERLENQIDRLVSRNLENIRWETLQNIDMAFRKFGSDLENTLSMVIRTTHGTIESALADKEMHEEKVADQIRELKKMKSDVLDVIRLFEPDKRDNVFF